MVLQIILAGILLIARIFPSPANTKISARIICKTIADKVYELPLFAKAIPVKWFDSHYSLSLLWKWVDWFGNNKKKQK